MWLPTDGSFYASRHGGPEFKGWNAEMYALVALVNAVRGGNHILMMANRDLSKPKPKPPEPFPTPTTKPNAPKPGSFAATAARMLAAQRKKKELLNGR